MSMINFKKVLKKILILTIVLSVFFSFTQKGNVKAEQTLYYLGGQTAGFVLNEKGVDVLSVTDVLCENGTVSPCKNADIRIGDVILSINGKDVTDGLSLEKLVSENGNDLKIKIKREGKILLKDVVSAKDLNGKNKLGLIVRDAITGIGTITYYTKNTFSALGHSISNENGEIFSISGGKAFSCMVVGVEKGGRGYTGELKGVFSPTDEIGIITANTKTGLKGELSSPVKSSQKLIRIDKAKPGKASIFSCINGNEVKEYSISIVKADLNKANKNFVIKITDKELLEVTGGIVQGMSGSPIVQNGKLVGAITHVFVGDAQRGYGISVQNMINE